MIPWILLVFFDFILSNLFQETLNGIRCISPGFPRDAPIRVLKNLAHKKRGPNPKIQTLSPCFNQLNTKPIHSGPPQVSPLLWFYYGQI